MKQIAVRIEEDDLNTLTRMAEGKRTTVSQLIREAIAEMIFKYRETIADKGW